MKDEESTIGAANGRMVACLTITSGNCTHRNCICNGTNWYILSSNACCPQTKWPNKTNGQQEGKVQNLPNIAIMHDGMIRCSFLLGVFT